MSKTVRYYDDDAAGYFDRTVGLDVSQLRRRFVAHLPRGGKILDAGAGSGRDARAFLDDGYEVVAIDASQGMAKEAGERLGIEVEVLRLEEMEFEREFDGVWACASLLHVAARDLGDVLGRIARALKPKGVAYLSFKKGEGEEWRGGRRFHDLEADDLRVQIEWCDELSVLEIWESTFDGLAPGEGKTIWINGLVQKRRA